MAYDEKMAERIRAYFEDRLDVEEKKMFGGLCYMVKNHMCCGLNEKMLMARVGPDRFEECLSRKHAREMDFTGRSLKGMVYVEPAGTKSDASLVEWLTICTEFVDSLPPKKPKRKKT